jgi:hypothetical protein
MGREQMDAKISAILWALYDGISLRVIHGPQGPPVPPLLHVCPVTKMFLTLSVFM